jgi:phosphatidate cytidylyltransferase
MLKHRLLMSAVLIPATIALFYWDHQTGEQALLLFLLVIVLSARATWELVTLARNAGLCPSLPLALAGSWAMICIGWTPYRERGWGSTFRERGGWESMWTIRNFGPDFFLLGVITIVLILNAVWRFPRCTVSVDSKEDLTTSSSLTCGREIATLGFELFSVVYLGIFLEITTQLRMHSNGYFALGALVVAAKTGDIGAYTFGRLIGGPKMVPRLSPGKTWAGGVGHLLTAGICSVAWLCWLGPMISPEWSSWHVMPAVVFGIVVGFAGLIGDLAESLIKRDFGVKDAPALLPGFGGLLDLLDSILLAGPVAYAMWHLLR